MHFGGLTVVLGMLLAGGDAVVGSASLPEDPRLEPVRARLEAVVAKAAAAGLPADLVVSKVREGLAKGVDASRIEVAASRLAESLDVAHQFVVQRRPGRTASPALVRALAEARVAGVDFAEADAVVRSDRTPLEMARAVEVLTDLSLRGYPAGRASTVVKDVLARDPGAIARLPAALETIRQEHALTHVESVDALSRGLAGGGSLQTAYSRTVDDERRKGKGRGGKPAQSGEGEAGKSGIIPPGLAKKGGRQGRGPRK